MFANNYALIDSYKANVKKKMFVHFHLTVFTLFKVLLRFRIIRCH